MKWQLVAYPLFYLSAYDRPTFRYWSELIIGCCVQGNLASFVHQRILTLNKLLRCTTSLSFRNDLSQLNHSSMVITCLKSAQNKKKKSYYCIVVSNNHRFPFNFFHISSNFSLDLHYREIVIHTAVSVFAKYLFDIFCQSYCPLLILCCMYFCN